MHQPLAEIESHRLARPGVRARCLPIQLVVTVAEVLQAGPAGERLLDEVGGRSERAVEALHRHGRSC